MRRKRLQIEAEVTGADQQSVSISGWIFLRMKTGSVLPQQCCVSHLLWEKKVFSLSHTTSEQFPFLSELWSAAGSLHRPEQEVANSRTERNDAEIISEKTRKYKYQLVLKLQVKRDSCKLTSWVCWPARAELGKLGGMGRVGGRPAASTEEAFVCAWLPSLRGSIHVLEAVSSASPAAATQTGPSPRCLCETGTLFCWLLCRTMTLNTKRCRRQRGGPKHDRDI